MNSRPPPINPEYINNRRIIYDEAPPIYDNIRLNESPIRRKHKYTTISVLDLEKDVIGICEKCNFQYIIENKTKNNYCNYCKKKYKCPKCIIM